MAVNGGDEQNRRVSDRPYAISKNMLADGTVEDGVTDHGAKN